jgi:hypothetical protein
MSGKIVNFEEYKERKRREGLSEGVQECLDVVENCKNPMSYGEICVLCNKCGRFGEETGR